VLLVDDDDMLLSVGQTMLKQLGFNALKAENGSKAIELLKEHSDEVSCILLDLSMPGMDGKETFDELRKISSDVPIILSSGYAEIDANERFPDRDRAGFIQKPYTLSNLRDKLSEALGSSIVPIKT
jgi:CheY-like chemotaxis protein